MTVQPVSRARAVPPPFAAGEPTDADYLEPVEPIVDPEDVAVPDDEVAAAPSIGTRTAADLLFGPAPAQLVGEFLTPEGPTILYGPGGVGKGITSCHLALSLARAGHVVMLLDFEGHEREWGSRLRGLGATDAELARIHYRAPFGPDWTALTGSLAAVVDLVRDDADRLGATYLVVDSYSVATSSGDVLGGQEAAREYFTALTRIGLPSLTIAHVRGDSARFPDRPFGSVFVHNLARETWAVEQTGKPTDEDEPDAAIAPNLIELEFRNRKRSDRRSSRPQFIAFEFFGDGTIEIHEGRQAEPTVADLIGDVLIEPMTLKQIAAAIREDTGTTYPEDTLLKTLKRHPERFTVNRGKRPAKWSGQR